MKFVVQPLSWYKRRVPTENVPIVEDFEITEFEKVDNSYCKVFVKFDNGDEFNVDGRVSRNVTHIVGGGIVINNWTVQSINQHGLSVVFKLVE